MGRPSLSLLQERSQPLLNVLYNTGYTRLECFKNNRITCPVVSGKIYCPIEDCSYTTKAKGTMNLHLKQQHTDPICSCLQFDENVMFQPDILQGSKVSVFTETQRAFCRSSLVYLRQSEIPFHIASCRACSSKFKFPNYFPALDVVTDQPYTSLKKKDRVEIGFWIELKAHDKQTEHRICYKTHEFFVDVNMIEPRVKENWKLSEIDGGELPTGKFCEVNYSSISRLPNRPSSNLLPLDDQMVVHVLELNRMINSCVVGFTSQMVERVGIMPKTCKDINGRYNQQLEYYYLKDAAEIEVRLAGIKPFQFKTKNGLELRDDVFVYLNLLTQVAIGRFNSTCTFIVGGDPKVDNVVQIVDGRLYLGKHKIPWCIGELILRYLLCVRPLQAKYDGEQFESNELFLDCNASDRFAMYQKLSTMKVNQGQLYEPARIARDLISSKPRDLSKVDNALLSKISCYILEPY